MNTVCKHNQCVGCYACVDLCPKKAITIKDDTFSLNAVIDQDLCVGCNICHKICQVNNPVEKVNPIEWNQGWTQNEKIRQRSSSGGLAAELSHTIIKKGGIVCSCVFSDGEFVFQFAESEKEMTKFAGSKYVKSRPENVHKRITQLLNCGKTVLFIGLPCQCGAVKKQPHTLIRESFILWI